jgi:hypothetical protein
MTKLTVVNKAVQANLNSIQNRDLAGIAHKLGFACLMIEAGFTSDRDILDAIGQTADTLTDNTLYHVVRPITKDFIKPLMGFNMRPMSGLTLEAKSADVAKFGASLLLDAEGKRQTKKSFIDGLQQIVNCEEVAYKLDATHGVDVEAEAKQLEADKLEAELEAYNTQRAINTAFGRDNCDIDELLKVVVAPAPDAPVISATPKKAVDKSGASADRTAEILKAKEIADTVEAVAFDASECINRLMTALPVSLSNKAKVAVSQAMLAALTEQRQALTVGA